MKLCREDGRVNPWKNSKTRLLPQNLSLKRIKQRLQKTNASGRLSNCSGNAFCPSGRQVPTDGLRSPLRLRISRKSLLSLGGRFTFRLLRSEERRVGKRCKSRWSAD